LEAARPATSVPALPVRQRDACRHVYQGRERSRQEARPDQGNRLVARPLIRAAVLRLFGYQEAAYVMEPGGTAEVFDELRFEPHGVGHVTRYASHAPTVLT